MKARLLIATLALICSGVVMADAPTWAELNDQQRIVLGQFEESWDSLPAERRMRLSRGAQRLLVKTVVKAEAGRLLGDLDAVAEPSRLAILANGGQKVVVVQRDLGFQHVIGRGTLVGSRGRREKEKQRCGCDGE